MYSTVCTNTEHLFRSKDNAALQSRCRSNTDRRLPVRTPASLRRRKFIPADQTPTARSRLAQMIHLSYDRASGLKAELSFGVNF